EVFADGKLYESDGKNLYEIESPVKLDERNTLKELIKISILCNDSKLDFNNGKYNIVGTPTENALVKLANSMSINPQELREK
ncbi:MAG: hypothetical protein N3A00_04955, partial [Thermodesulfovibrio sp.]|nr:hypothetical protein [Thermodesulfovibrio sp.]